MHADDLYELISARAVNGVVQLQLRICSKERA